ncbi:MAG: glycogen synthase [[Candidatus Thermochlorobacteriaceae] bacterium GBChlB]|jgi:starch synthase|nr:MAG: glycogen synthase [[Candidatus Thermochlorobacteriaceae] bacterium GBChlB]
MAKKLKILFVSGEVVPFAKTGGLADVMGSLPQAVEDCGNEARIMMPKYGVINDRKFRLHDVLRLKDLPIPVGERHDLLNVKVTALPSSKIQTYFLYNEGLFKRDGLYVSPSTKKDYQDNDERFIFFNRAVLETLKALGWKPDVIHCHDWMSGLIPAYLKLLYHDDPFFKNVKTVFTIHNLAYQGAFHKSALQKSKLPESEFTPDGLEFYDSFNFMKIALVYADAITTVSEKYAEEIRTDDELACGLKGVLNKRKKDLYGILNGVDEKVWNPEEDEFIEKNYNADDLAAKLENKKGLLKRLKLPYNEKTPVIGIISRLVDQKGFDLVIEAFDKLMSLDMQLVLLGTGEKQYEDFFRKATNKYPDKVSATISFNDELAHQIEAGSDMFLMPSRYEPCGMNQMYSLKYGTVPIVRATGGLHDTVKAFKGGKGNGFVFEKYTANDMMKAIKEALETYKDQKAWAKLVQNGMATDVSWESSAEKYNALYHKLLESK